MKFRIYLDTGATIDFAADELTIERDRLSGELASLAYEGASGDVPRYVSLSHVIALTREVEVIVP